MLGTSSFFPPKCAVPLPLSSSTLSTSAEEENTKQKSFTEHGTAMGSSSGSTTTAEKNKKIKNMLHHYLPHLFRDDAKNGRSSNRTVLFPRGKRQNKVCQTLFQKKRLNIQFPPVRILFLIFIYIVSFFPESQNNGELHKYSTNTTVVASQETGGLAGQEMKVGGDTEGLPRTSRCFPGPEVALSWPFRIEA